MRYAAGDRFGSWTLRRYIDAGSNGEVWEVEGDAGQACALKALVHFGGDGYPRFKREVEIVSGLDPDAYAILPVLDASLPARPRRDNGTDGFDVWQCRVFTTVWSADNCPNAEGRDQNIFGLVVG